MTKQPKYRGRKMFRKGFKVAKDVEVAYIPKGDRVTRKHDTTWYLMWRSGKIVKGFATMRQAIRYGQARGGAYKGKIT